AIFTNKGYTVIAAIWSVAKPNSVLPNDTKILKTIRHGPRIGGFGSPIRCSKFSVRRHDRHRISNLHPQQGLVQHMHTPIRHLAPSIIPKPTKLKMKPVWIEKPLE